jgi:hypothetical protein
MQQRHWLIRMSALTAAASSRHARRARTVGLSRPGTNRCTVFEQLLRRPVQERDPNAPLGLYPSLFSALQTELGLKLVPFVGTNKMLVIDHIERPTEN